MASLPDTRVDCSTWIRDGVHGAEGCSRHIEDLTWTESSASGSLDQGEVCELKMGWMWSTENLEGVGVKEVLLGERSGNVGGPNLNEDGSCLELGTCRICPLLILNQGCSGPPLLFRGVRLEEQDAPHQLPQDLLDQLHIYRRCCTCSRVSLS